MCRAARAHIYHGHRYRYVEPIRADGRRSTRVGGAAALLVRVPLVLRSGLPRGVGNIFLCDAYQRDIAIAGDGG